MLERMKRGSEHKRIEGKRAASWRGDDEAGRGEPPRCEKNKSDKHARSQHTVVTTLSVKIPGAKYKRK